MNRSRSNQAFTLVLILALGCVALAVGQETGTPSSEEDSTQVQALYERMLIRELQDRYGIVHDFGTPEEYASLFTDDGAISAGNGPPLVQGRDALIAFARRDRERWSGEPAPDGTISSIMRHLITNAEIEVTGPDTAVGKSYVTTIVQRGDIGPAILSVGRYEDHYVKQNGQWRISRRSIHMDFGDQDLARVLGFRSD
jgi:hypothetical protein